MSAVIGPRATRREFIAALAASGGLLVGTKADARGEGGLAGHAIDSTPALGEGAQPWRRSSGDTLAAWLKIDGDGTVTVYCSQAEMGQGIYTGFAQIVAEELGADWARVRAETAPGGPDYAMTLLGITGQFTGASFSTYFFDERLRRAAAKAREVLKAAAAARWQLPISSLRTARGEVLHPPSGRKLGFGELASDAAKLPLPDAASVALAPLPKRPGAARRRLDTPAKVDGSAVFGIDVRVPGMVHATVRHSPRIGARIVGFNEEQVRAEPGVIAVIPLQGDAVLVVAESTWQAMSAARKMVLQLDESQAFVKGSAELSAEMRASLAGPGIVMKNTGDARTVLERSPRRIEATFESGYLAHATLEPPCAVADVRADRATLWLPTQGPDLVRFVLADILKLQPDNIQVNVTYVGGGFGRKFKPDFAIQAALASRIVGRPVKLTWMRDEDLKHDPFKPAFVVRLSAKLGPDGLPEAVSAVMAGQSVLASVVPGWDGSKGDEASVEGLRDQPYDWPNLYVQQNDLSAPIALGFMRSVGAGPNGFFREVFIDEMALAAKRDPVAYRLAMLPKDPRAAAVLRAAARKAGWPRASRPDRFLGVAYSSYIGRNDTFVTRVAEVAEVSLSREGWLKVWKVTAAVDCGRVINPNLVRAQVEGSIGFAYSCMRHQITFDRGMVEQNSFADYSLLTLADMPAVNVVLMPSTEPPSGIGEPAMVPFAPAVANALFAATGQRLRKLPITDADLRPNA